MYSLIKSCLIGLFDVTDVPTHNCPPHQQQHRLNMQVPWEAVAAKMEKDIQEETAKKQKERGAAGSSTSIPEPATEGDETFEGFVKRRVFQSTATIYKSNGKVYNDLWSSGVSHIRHWR